MRDVLAEVVDDRWGAGGACCYESVCKQFRALEGSMFIRDVLAEVVDDRWAGGGGLLL
jgi:hypothetical protein